MFTLGAGSVDRNWSFSPKTSLILSSNARPVKSIYLSFNNEMGFQSEYVSWLGPTSIEFFNGITEGPLNPKESMLIGTRIVIKPLKKLNIELFRTAQWGGEGYNHNLNSFLNTLSMQDTNVGKNEHVNQLAGIGLSYNLNTLQSPILLYSQIAGEDESGNLPSCLIYLAGIQWEGSLFNLPTTFGIETIDTRVGRTKNGFCGVNTAYNNNTYKYTNYGKVMGVDIDTEGKAFEIYGNTLFQNDLSIDYSYKNITINDADWSLHRLSSSRETGSISSIGLVKKSGNIKLTGQIRYHSLSLDKSNIKDGVNIASILSIKF